MTLEVLKIEYKKSIEYNKMDKRDAKALIDEIDDAETLDEFIKVVELWAIPKDNESPERIILNRILDK
jgi:hypothetical protein